MPRPKSMLEDRVIDNPSDNPVAVDSNTGEITPAATSNTSNAPTNGFRQDSEYDYHRAMRALYRALALAQQDLGRTSKDGKGHHGKYSTLPACLETITNAFNGKGLSYIFISHPDPSAAVIEFKIFHEEGGELSLGIVSIPFAQNTPASRGASQTYAKRYACSLIGLQSADDAEQDEKHLHGVPKAITLTDEDIAVRFSYCATIEAIGNNLKSLIALHPQQREQLTKAATARKLQLQPSDQPEGEISNA